MFQITFLSLFLIFFLGCDSDNTIAVKESNSPQKISSPSIPMLGVLVNYSNIQISSNDNIWNKKLFGQEQNQLNHYYLQASSNNFKFTQAQESSATVNDGIISIHLNKKHPNIDIDSHLFTEKVYGDLKDALQATDNFIDFSNYDTDANGYITPNELLITFIIAGYEDAYEGMHVTNGVWGHQSCMVSDSNIPTLDGVKLMDCSNSGNFALFGERHNMSNPHDATIGIIAHELGHSAFDLPDLYNTTNYTSGGIGFFGLMGSGTWASKNSNEYAGNTPTHFSAWSKIYNGWITPITANESSASLHETASLNYNIIKIPINQNSYYLLENRNNSGYDRGLNSLTGEFNGGIAIWRVNETKLTQTFIDNNTINADTHNKGIDLVEALNGTIDSNGDGGNENALYYKENVSFYENIVSDISQRGSTMNLIIN